MKRPYPSSTSTTRRVERRLLPLPGSIPRMAMAVCVALGGRRCAYAFIGYSGGATPAAAAVGGSLRRMGQSPMSLKTAVPTATAARFAGCRRPVCAHSSRNKHSRAASGCSGGVRPGGRRSRERRHGSSIQSGLAAVADGGVSASAADIELSSSGGEGRPIQPGGTGEQQQQLPFATEYHVPVVCNEVLQWLITDREGIYVDCTLGGGGHSAALLAALGTGARVVGLDRDPAALREASARLSTEAAAGRFQAVRSNFADITEAVESCELLSDRRANDDGFPLPPAGTPTKTPTEAVPRSTEESSSAPGDSALVDGILVDLGVSSHQIDDGARGFSFSADGPLDMRMDGFGHGSEIAGLNDSAHPENRYPETSEMSQRGSRAPSKDHPLSAADVVNYVDEREIREVIFRFGEEKRSTKIARAIVSSRPITTTKNLAEVVGVCAPPNERTKTLARVFQALRIKVNGELDALEALLNQAKDLVKPGGRLVVLSYHSLEDRRVKRVMATGNLQGTVVKDFYGSLLSPWKPLTRKPLKATEEEVILNPRARSVRLRVAERTELP